MELLPSEIRALLPNLYAQSSVEDPIAYVKLFSPYANWTWFILEIDQEGDECFGFVIGFESEFGYFSLSELAAQGDSFWTTVERDLLFTPQPLSVARQAMLDR